MAFTFKLNVNVFGDLMQTADRLYHTDQADLLAEEVGFVYV